jgi:predicted patatin/cPLA2 family phospholipase
MGKVLKAAQAITAKTKIAIACQGGGSQTAFTAGALKALCEARIADEFEIVSMSGTSGGLSAPCSSGTHLSATITRRGDS